MKRTAFLFLSHLYYTQKQEKIKRGTGYLIKNDRNSIVASTFLGQCAEFSIKVWKNLKTTGIM